jgi:hypothetical protein
MRRTALLFGVLVASVAASPSFAAFSGSGPPSILDGRWKSTNTVDGLLQTGEVGAKEVGQLRGTWTAHFAPGRFDVRNQLTGGLGQGTFVVTGNRVRFVFASGVDVRPGSVAVCTASVFRDRLTFTKVPGQSCLAWDAAVWQRVR